MMLGVELVSDGKLKTPAQSETLHVMDQMKGEISFPLLVLAIFYKLLINNP